MSDDVMDKAIADRDRRPWRYYRFERDDLMRMLDEIIERAEKAEGERDVAIPDNADIVKEPDGSWSGALLDGAVTAVGGTPGEVARDLFTGLLMILDHHKAENARLREALDGVRAIVTEHKTAFAAALRGDFRLMDILDKAALRGAQEKPNAR